MVTVGLLIFALVVFAYAVFWLVLAYRYRKGDDVTLAVAFGVLNLVAASLVLLAALRPTSARYAIGTAGLLLAGNAVVGRLASRRAKPS